MGLKPSCCTTCTADNDLFRLNRRGYQPLNGTTIATLYNMDCKPVELSRFDKSATSKSLYRSLVDGYIRQIYGNLAFGNNSMHKLRYLVLEYLFFAMHMVMRYGSFDKIYSNPCMLDKIGEDGSNYWFYTSCIDGQQYSIKKFQKLHAKRQYITHCEAEINILSKLNHPNIIKLIDIFEDKKEVSLIYEYCAGQDLEEFIDEIGRLRETDAKKIIIQILKGLKYLHKHGIIHLNLKPESIWFKYGVKSNNIDYKLRSKASSLSYNNTPLTPMTPLTPNTPSDFNNANAAYSTLIAPQTPDPDAPNLPSLPSWQRSKSNPYDNRSSKHVLCIFNFEMAQKLPLVKNIRRIVGAKDKVQPQLSLFDESSGGYSSPTFEFNEYSAPELKQERYGMSGSVLSRYTSQCDMWSVGCILYYILCGYPPFQQMGMEETEDSEEEMSEHREGSKDLKYFFSTKEWNKLSVNARDLIIRLMKRDPNQRLTARLALKHPWFKQHVNGNKVKK